MYVVVFAKKYKHKHFPSSLFVPCGLPENVGHQRQEGLCAGFKLLSSTIDFLTSLKYFNKQFSGNGDVHSS